MLLRFKDGPINEKMGHKDGPFKEDGPRLHTRFNRETRRPPADYNDANRGSMYRRDDCDRRSWDSRFGLRSLLSCFHDNHLVGHVIRIEVVEMVHAMNPGVDVVLVRVIIDLIEVLMTVDTMATDSDRIEVI